MRTKVCFDALSWVHRAACNLQMRRLSRVLRIDPSNLTPNNFAVSSVRFCWSDNLFLNVLCDKVIAIKMSGVGVLLSFSVLNLLKMVQIVIS